VHVLTLMHPKLVKLLKLKENIKYIEAVNELCATPGTCLLSTKVLAY
jgi:histidinol phosphatase-like PHP family hydrolase